jgi:ribosomal protein S8
MESKLIDRMAALLKEEGFLRVLRQSTTHSATISADKGMQRIVVHLTDQQEVPRQASRIEEVPSPSEIRLRAMVPGLRPEAQGNAGQRMGQGGGLRKLERLKRR